MLMGEGRVERGPVRDDCSHHGFAVCGVSTRVNPAQGDSSQGTRINDRAELMERFIHEDVAWGLHGDEQVLL